MTGLLLAGVASGVGKTTICVGLIAALRRRGLSVQPFKVGPDYIDTSYHARAAGVPSRNLDLWLLPPPVLRALYARAARRADVAVVEGVMGLFDGRLGGEGRASSAHLARELGLPVVLVVDAGRLSWSAGALVLGYRHFLPGLELAGVILNRVGGPRHAAELVAAVQGRAGVPVLGWLPSDPALAVPERYLGLVPTTEGTTAAGYFAAAEAAVARAVDLDRLLALARASGPPPPDDAPDLFPPTPVRPRAAIAVARDRAFSFYYQDSLELLEAWGAELAPFSPLEDTALPRGASGVYLGGGFPELFAAQLSANAPLLAALRQAHAQGMPLYAECGGLMALGRSLVDAEGHRHPMAGVAPLDSTLAGQRLTIGYREARAARPSPLLHAGEAIRAHEFHWSGLEAEPPAEEAAYRVAERQPSAEGFVSGNTLASYLHLHFGADERGRLARRFVEAAAAGYQRSAPARWPPGEIERLSLARLEARAGAALPTDPAARGLVRRVLYAAGDPELAALVQVHPSAVPAGLAALRAGAPVIADVAMVAAGLRRDHLRRLGCAVLVAVEQPDARRLAAEAGITRSAAGVRLLAPRLGGAVVAIGNAPTALLELLELLDAGAPPPAIVLGMPVGLVAAAESKEELTRRGVPYATLLGSRGGSPLAAAAVNALVELLGQADAGEEEGEVGGG